MKFEKETGKRVIAVLKALEVVPEIKNETTTSIDIFFPTELHVLVDEIVYFEKNR